MTAHSADRPATGAGRFTQQEPLAPRRSKLGALFAGLGLLALVVGLPAGLYVLAEPLLQNDRLSQTLTLTGTLGIDQVLAVLVVVAALAWLQFVICVLVEIGAALRGGVLAAPVPLSGPSQRLARWLVGSMLLVGVMAGQMGVAQAAPRADLGSARAAASISVAASSDPDTLYVFDANTAAPEVQTVSHGSSRHLTAQQAAAEAATARRAARAERDAGLTSREELALDGHKVYVVQPTAGRHHDTLWEIAERHLGDGRRYHEIYRLNEGRTQPDGRSLHLARLIQPGWRLIMPEDAVGVSRWVADRSAGSDADPGTDEGARPPGGQDNGAGSSDQSGAAGSGGTQGQSGQQGQGGQQGQSGQQGNGSGQSAGQGSGSGASAAPTAAPTPRRSAPGGSSTDATATPGRSAAPSASATSGSASGGATSGSASGGSAAGGSASGGTASGGSASGGSASGGSTSGGSASGPASGGSAAGGPVYSGVPEPGDPRYVASQHPDVVGQGMVLPTDPTPPRGTTRPGGAAASSGSATSGAASSSSAASSGAQVPGAGASGAATSGASPSTARVSPSTGTSTATSTTAATTTSSSSAAQAPPSANETTAPSAAVPRDTAQSDGQVVGQPEVSADQGSSDGPGLPAELIGAGLVTAALLGTLLLIRRRRRGGPDEPGEIDRDTEVWLRTGADADRGALLDLALRSLPRACREAQLPLPQAYGAVVDDEGLDLLLTMAHPSAPPPWAGLDDGLRWRLTYADAQHLVAHGDSAYPLLASVGRDQLGRDALINLGAAAGPVAVVGSPAMSAAVVRALALGLAGNPWSRGIEVLTADLPPALPAIAAGRLIPCNGAKDLTEQLEQGQSRMPRTGPVQILTGGPAPGSRPERVAIYGAPLTVQTASRLQAVVGRGADLAVVIAGDLPGARWRLQVDDNGVLTCEELSLQVTANRLGDGSIERLHSLFVSAGTPDLPTASGPQGERVAEPDGVVETDDITWAQAAVRVAILGEVEVQAPGSIDPRRQIVAEEILAYLALHPAGTHPTVLGSAIWPRGVTADVRDDMLAEVRDWLGTDGSGHPRLREGTDGRLRLSSDVPCDWDVLRTLTTRADRTKDRTRERDLLVRALHLVRGPLIGGIAHGTYTWVPRTGIERQAEHLVLDAASRLCKIASEDGDQLAVEQAATAGLRAVPHAQHLWRYIIRAEYALGGPSRLNDVADHVRFVLASSGVDMEPETTTLIDHLAGSSPVQTGSY